MDFMAIECYGLMPLKSLKIHEKNTKENHNRVGSLYVIKKHLTLCVKKLIFLDLEKSFQNFLRELAY